MLKCLKEDRQIYAINVAELSASDEPQKQPQTSLTLHDAEAELDLIETKITVPDLSVNPLGDCQVSSSTDIMNVEEEFWNKNGMSRYTEFLSRIMRYVHAIL